MKKLIRTIHLWLGLTSGLVVFIVSVTGCIYVFEEELKEQFYAHRNTIDVPDQAIKKPLSVLLAAAQKEVGEQHPIQTVEVANAANRTYTFRTAPVRDASAYTYFGEIVYQRKIYVDPYTGDVVKNENTKFEFFTMVLRLHRNLWLNKSVGSFIVGSAVLVFVILLITGIVLWWPKKKKGIKKSFSFNWKSTTKWKRKNYDLHSVLGFYASFILLIIALTGLTWAFTWFDNSVQWLANGGVKNEKIKPVYSDTTQVTDGLPIDKIFLAVVARNPHAHTYSFFLPEKSKGVINAGARADKHVRHTSTRYQFDQFTGSLLKTATFSEKNTGEKLKAMNYDIHVGAIAGLPGKFLAFFAALISASLPVTGFIVWYGKKNKKTKEEKSAVKETLRSPRSRSVTLSKPKTYAR